MRSFLIPTLILILLLLFGCATGRRDTDGLDQKSRAETFDRYVHGKLNVEEISELKAACRKGAQENIFCFSFLRSDRLDQKIKEKMRIPEPSPPKPPIESIPVKYAKNRIINWRELRRADIPPLLKGLQNFELKQLRTIAGRALAESRCPNNIAVAVAASLEEFLPDKKLAIEISKLYEKGAVCARKVPADRENFLTRAGLLVFQTRAFKRAVPLLSRASRTKNAFTGRSLYWLYRASESLKDRGKATLVLSELQSKYPFSFHALVAGNPSKDPAEVLQKTGVVALKRSQKAKMANALIEQAEILRHYEYETSASILVDWALEEFPKLEPEVKIYLAELGDPRTKVLTLPDVLTQNPKLLSRYTLELSFPKPFFPLFEKNSARLDPYLLLSVARKESTFNPKAISPANAQGLLQILPETSQKLTSSSVDLLNPENSIELGARYLSELMNKMNGQLYLALASYNAGEEQVTSWLKRFPNQEPILFIDLIPYRETREYVGAVLRNYYWYRRIHQSNDTEFAKRIIELDIARK